MEQMNMSTELQLTKMQETINSLTQAVQFLCKNHGARLNQQQLADRLGVHRNTIANMLERDRRMPRPGKDGKFLLSEIIDWEIYGRQP